MDDDKFSIDDLAEDELKIHGTLALNSEISPYCNLAVDTSKRKQLSIKNADFTSKDSYISSPEFNKDVYFFTVFEDEDVGTTVAIVTVSDPDEGSNNEVTYSVLQDWGQDRFLLNNVTGAFTLTQPLDYEEAILYTLIIGVSDNSEIPLSSSVKCYFSVVDVNDNAPVFSNDIYEEYAQEDVAIGTVVTTVTAIDADSGLNGAIAYAIISGDPNGDFDILNNGSIVTAMELDRESKPTYWLNVTAMDEPLNKTLQQSAVAQVIVHLIDVNDNAPEFINDNVTGILEEVDINEVVIHVQAVDIDSGSNGDVNYAMDALNSDVFSMRESGVIVTSGELDRELVSEYVLTVYAADQGIPALTSTMDILVNILDINDNAPDFNPSSYTCDIMENTPPGKEFLQVSATDPDEGLNGTIEFSITDGNDGNDFAIDEDSGVIVLSNSVDRERQPQYVLTIMAKDKGLPPQSSSTDVTINLLDINDNIPEFTEEYMTVYIDENYNNTPVLVKRCHAVDDDDGSNGQLTFQILKVTLDPDIPDIIVPYCGGVGMATQNIKTLEDSYFAINSSNGDVYVTEALDREKESKYYLVLAAHDAGSPSLTGTGILEIQVNDINDNQPEFTQAEYWAKIQEEQDTHVFVTTVTATDKDAGDNGQITYELDTNSTNQKFAIDHLTGEITTVVRLDREEETSYTILVVARDNAGDLADVLSSTATVYVDIMDINDNAPQFINEPYSLVVPDAISAGTSVYAVTAIDGDIGTNAELEYGKGRSNDSNKFLVDKQSGAIRTSSALSDQNSQYWFEVRVTDGCHESTVNISIRFEDANIFPKFVPITSLFDIDEDMDIRYVVTEDISANSIKDGFEGIISYHLSSGNFNETFGINTLNGEVTLDKSLDHELIESYDLFVEARDRSTPPLSSFLKLEINVIDINDNAPEFSENIYNGCIREEQGPDISVLTVSATDRDSDNNGVFSYSLESNGNIDNAFRIDAESGNLVTNSGLDRETLALYTLKVYAIDQGTPPLTGTTMVEVKVTDINDNRPIFDSHPIAYVREHSEIGTLVLKVMTTDADEGSNAVTIYAFPNTWVGDFTINNTTGVITITADIDREENDSYAILLTATDLWNTHSSTTTVQISVCDINDNAPEFNQSEYRRILPEALPVGSVVTTIYADDRDIGRNKQVTYSMMSWCDYFTVDPTGGVIRLNKVILYKTPSSDIDQSNNYYCTVVAMDRGIPTLWSYVVIMVTIYDRNDHAPQFTEDLYTARVERNASIHTRVIQVFATDDDDEGYNSLVFYDITGGNGSSKFIIERDSGWVLVNQSIDGDVRKIFSLEIRACDQGYIPMIASATVSISVSDTNLNIPKFPFTVYRCSVDENVQLGLSIIQVTASDADSGLNGQVQYAITGGDDNGEFALGSENGTITVAKPLDYDNGPKEYNLIVTARDLGVVAKTSAARVNVKLNDINDNPPVFESKYYSKTIPENSPFGTSITTVKATDKDEGSNAYVEYLITGGDGQHIFTIFQQNGTIISKGNLNYEGEKKLFNLEIRARHPINITMYDTVTVTIHITGVNEYKPEFVKHAYVFTVSEAASDGQVIGKISARDADQGEGGRIVYVFIGGSTRRGFAVNEDSGNVYVSYAMGRLDHEHEDSILLLAVAKNEGEIEGLDFDEADIYVNVTEVGDQPSFGDCESYPCYHGDCDAIRNGYLCYCYEGYTSTNCQIEAGPCEPQPCFYEGRCVTQDKTFYCDCKFGERGEFCEFSSFSFMPLSYIKYPGISGSSLWISLQFATTSNNALLVYNYGSEKSADSKFIALEIINGQMWFSYNIDVSLIRISTTQVVSDGEWHTATATIDKTESILTIDQCDETIQSNYCSATTLGSSHINLAGDSLNIGGVQSIDSITLYPGQVSTSDFVGCMRDIYINGEFYDLKPPLDAYRVSIKCPRNTTLCESNPCQNRGICVDDWWSYHCDCQEGFMGYYCELEGTSLTFGGDSFVEYILKDSYWREQAVRATLKRSKRSVETQTTSMLFRTRHRHGLLFYSKDMEECFTILEINENYLSYIFSAGNLGNGSMTLDDLNVSDGQWQNVTLAKDDDRITLTLNNNYTKRETFKISPPDFVGGTILEMFIGGMGEPLTNDGLSIGGLRGCIGIFMLNGEVVPLVGENDMVRAVLSKSNGGVTIGCDGADVCGTNPCPEGEYCLDEWEMFTCIPLGLCLSAPCENNGTCIPGKDEDSYTCQCIGDYSGINCEIVPECLTNPCEDYTKCSANGSGGYVCSPREDYDLIIAITVSAIILFLIFVLVFFVWFRRCKNKGNNTLRDSIKMEISLNDFEIVDEFMPMNFEGILPASGEDTKVGFLEQQVTNCNVFEYEQTDGPIIMDDEAGNITSPDVLQNYRVTRGVLPSVLQDDDVTPVLYDLDNASSLALSDVDVVYHFTEEANDRPRKLSTILKPQSNHQNHTGRSRQSPLGNPHLQGAGKNSLRTSPYIIYRKASFEELYLQRNDSDQSINNSELRSEKDVRSNASTASEFSGRAMSPRAQKSQFENQETVYTYEVSDQPVGLSLEEIAMLNLARPVEQADSLPSTQDGLSPASNNPQMESKARLAFHNPVHPWESSESSSEESIGTFTCSEFDPSQAKFKFDGLDPGQTILSKLAAIESEEDTDLPVNSDTWCSSASTDYDEPPGTLHSSRAVFTPIHVTPPNGQFSWDYYLVNWEPCFENLAGVFEDIALLQDESITLELNMAADQEEC
ncbi:protocadherin Fat 4-like [Glandiceps talaboti]